MTKQEIFDKVATHLLTQNEKSSKSIAITTSTNTTDNPLNKNELMCLYRSPNNLKCAIGCLIPDELYDKSMEGRTVSGLLADWPKLARILGVNRGSVIRDILVDLQMLHDWKPTGIWRAELLDIARSYSLDPAVVQK